MRNSYRRIFSALQKSGGRPDHPKSVFLAVSYFDLEDMKSKLRRIKEIRFESWSNWTADVIYNNLKAGSLK